MDKGYTNLKDERMNISKIITGLLLSILLGSGVAVAADYADGVAAYESEDYKTALEVFAPLAEQEDEGAQYYLGLLYDRGKGGVRKNRKTATQWFIKAAKQGLARAQLKVGARYSAGFGFGIERNDKTAVKWITKAAEQEFSPAYGSLGWRYHKGYGVPKNNKTAIKWYLKSIGQGHYYDASYLGDSYLELGNYVRAYMWYSIHGENGKRSGVRNANKIAADMTTKEINKAQLMSSRCLESNYTDC